MGVGVVLVIARARRDENHEYYADPHPGPLPGFGEGLFFLRTNSGGRTFRLVAAPVRQSAPEYWRELIPCRPEVMLASAEAFQDHLVLLEREGGLPRLRIVDLRADNENALASSHRIEFTEPAYNASLGDNPELDRKSVV